MMNENDKRIAEAALRRLCKGSRIGGICFGAILHILLDNNGEQEPIKGQLELTLGSSWNVFAARPTFFPNGEDELPEVSQAEQLQMICSIKERVITNVELGGTEPHLILTLDDEKVVFVNGKHDRYECWNIGVAFGEPEEFWFIVACPGGGVAVWTPISFDG